MFQLAREWYAALTPLSLLREEYIGELRREWGREDSCVYQVTIRGADEPQFLVAEPSPPRPIFEPIDLDALVSIVTHVVRWNRYVAADGRELCMLARSPEMRTIYADFSRPPVPIDYDRLGPDLGAIHYLWRSVGNHIAPVVCSALRALA